MAIPYSDDHRLIFIHIPKNAGTSIYRLFDLPPGHADIELIRGTLPADKVATYVKFAIVRNPFDRLVSNYLYAKMPNSLYHGKDNPHPDYRRLRRKSFGACVKLLKKGKLRHEGWGDQYQWVFREGLLVVDEILYFESLQEDLDEFCTKYGIVGGTLPVTNQSFNRNWRKFYTSRLMDEVLEFYQRDFERFYNLEGKPRLNRPLPKITDEA